MKKLLALLLIISMPVLVFAQSENPQFDPELAGALGADDYGMKWYTFVILKTGENTTADAETQQELFAGHLANIRRLSDEGLLIVAGPMEPNELSYRGLFVFDIDDKDEVYELLQTDPAVREKLLEPVMFRWYGSAALPEYLSVHQLIERISF